jgi:hypothetical protein|tara:strand:+ start:285 stop:467 length:183 start_codon:yes stop_codon:yes gene_type:complete
MDFLMLLVTALVYTCFGFYLGWSAQRQVIITETIDELIRTGFIKTRGTGDDMEILPYDET